MRYYSSAAGLMTLTADINSSTTLVPVSTVVGLPVSYPYTVVLDPGLVSEEIVTVTSASGTTLTVTRGQDGTSGQSHSLGGKVRHMMTARDLREPQDHMAATAGVHGVTGSVVGTTDTQVLSNKDLRGAGNIFPSTLATTTTTSALDTRVTALEVQKILNPPRVHAIQAVATSIPAFTWTRPVFGGVDIYDTDTMHDPATNNTRITAKTAGLYSIRVSVGIIASASGSYRLLQVRKNSGGVDTGGTQLFEARDFSPNGAWSTELSCGGDVYLAANDYIDVWVRHDATGSLNTVAADYFTYVQARWVSAS